MDINLLKEEVARINWWHSIDLGNGIITPGKSDSSKVLKRLKMPNSLQGRSVLDIGAWDGFFSFAAERRDASRVLAVDSYAWDGSGWGSKVGFELARRALNSKVEDKEIDILEITPQKIGTFDLVFFLGVLYHLRHPLLALEKVSSVTSGQLILSTHISMLNVKLPVMRFYPGDELSDDPTNWWSPNVLAVCDMLKDVGFRRVEVVTHSSFFRRFIRAVYRGLRERKRTFFEMVNEDDSVVFHAFK